MGTILTQPSPFVVLSTNSAHQPSPWNQFSCLYRSWWKVTTHVKPQSRMAYSLLIFCTNISSLLDTQDLLPKWCPALTIEHLPLSSHPFVNKIEGQLPSSLSRILLIFSLYKFCRNSFSLFAHLSGQQLNTVLKEITQQNFHLPLSWLN